jgi:septum formation protein
MAPKDLVMKHALAKGKDVAKNLKEGIIISADTLIVHDNTVLGKSGNAQEAKKALQKINGQNINCITGLAVIDIKNNQEIVDFESTDLKMKNISEAEIDKYIETEKPFDLAGSFAIQKKGAIFVEKINGCYFNVIGLPLHKLNNIFQQLGISIYENK